MSKKEKKGLLPEEVATLVPANANPPNVLKWDKSRVWTGPYNRWHDNCLEMVCDRIRLESNVRVCQYDAKTSTTDEIEFAHTQGEAPVFVALSGLKLPAGLTDPVSIEIKSADDKSVKLKVTPANKGIGVGVSALFQIAGASAKVA